MKFLLDENLSPLHARTVRDLGHDGVSAAEIGLSGADDDDVRVAAIEQDRFLLTLDADFANVLRYPPGETPGVARLRIHSAVEEAINAMQRRKFGIARRALSMRLWHDALTARRGAGLVFALVLSYGECMARFVSTTVRLDEEDVRALKRARAAGLSASDLIRKGLRVVASRYYPGRRSPSTGLFESTNSKLGDESQLFRDIKD